MRETYLFLDFDGVLHPAKIRYDLPDDENRHFAYWPRLEACLQPYDDIRLVIISSWRELPESIWRDAPEALRKADRAPLLKRCRRGPTPSRHREALAFLKAQGRGPKSPWLALDDLPGNYRAGCQNLVVCNDGFRDAEAALLKAAMDRIRC